MSSEEEPTFEDIEESELSGDNGEMYIFQWLSATEKKISEASMGYLKAKQSDLEASLVKLITAAAPHPLPGRAIRNVVARCLGIHALGNQNPFRYASGILEGRFR